MGESLVPNPIIVFVTVGVRDVLGRRGVHRWLKMVTIIVKDTVGENDVLVGEKLVPIPTIARNTVGEKYVPGRRVVSGWRGMVPIIV